MPKLKYLMLLAILSASATAAHGQNNVEPPLITVTGQAEVRVPPDEVLFTLAVENVDKDMVVASKKTDDSVRQILAIARKNNVKPEDVQTSQISVQPKYNTDDLSYEERNRVKRVLIGYEVSKTVAIRLRDLSRFDDLLADVLKAGITRLSNMQFIDSQVRKHRDEARRMAIRAAQEKAKLLAGEIGQAIGPAYSITENSGIDYGRASGTYQNTSATAGESSETEGATAPGSISITANVTVRFRLM
ncbi:MAG TPA: SIMPL domain-containing protein [Pyrinomonadaceae bacterium]|nr:SIMPL domain-containing protein [Pyrinomonadaceae bacterium]